MGVPEGATGGAARARAAEDANRLKPRAQRHAGRCHEQDEGMARLVWRVEV